LGTPPPGGIPRQSLSFGGYYEQREDKDGKMGNIMEKMAAKIGKPIKKRKIKEKRMRKI
jgi:hypothetical protein